MDDDRLDTVPEVVAPLPPPPGAIPSPEPTPNTSGEGTNAPVPARIEERWNWAAFLVPFLFAFAYLSPLWMALGAIPLVLGVFEDRLPWDGVPATIAALAVGLAFGGRANAVAWRARRWESVERFIRVQRWSAWVALILSIALASVFASPGEGGVGSTVDEGGFSTYDEHGVAFEYPSTWDANPSEDLLIGVDRLRRNSRWVVFIVPPAGADFVTLGVLDLPTVTARQLTRTKDQFARSFAASGDSVIRSDPVVTTLGSATAIRFSVDGTAPIGTEITSDVVAAATLDGLLIFRCDYDRGDPNGTAAGCQHVIDTFDVPGARIRNP